MNLQFMQCGIERTIRLFVCYRRKQMDVSFSCIWPVIDNELRHNIVKVVRIQSYFDNVMMKFMINNRTDMKTGVNLLSSIFNVRERLSRPFAQGISSQHHHFFADFTSEV